MPEPRRVAFALQIHLLYKWHQEIFVGAHRYADEQGWETVIDDDVSFKLAEAGKGRRPYDGVIARVEGFNADLVKWSSRRGLPVVNVLRGSSAFEKLPGVFPDYKAVGRLRAEHLISRGFRNLGCLVAQRSVTDMEQAEGFIEVAKEAGCTVSRFDLKIVISDSMQQYRERMAAFKQWMDTWQLPIGLGITGDFVAREVITLCKAKHLRMPGEVAVVAGKNEEKLCVQPHPSMTSVDIGYERVGYEAARMLDGLMKQASSNTSRSPRGKQAQADPEHRILPPAGVVVRESSDFYAVDDDLVSRSMTYIAEQCHMRLVVDDVATAMEVSPKTLQNRFASALGRSVAHEIRRVRIERAKRELVGSERSIEDIATRVGFSSRTLMDEVFKRELGESPSSYRKRHQVPDKV